MKPRVLVLYYTQSGQLRNILDSITSKITAEVDLAFCEIVPETPWPFPWKPLTFFDAMPETVFRKPAPVKALPADVVSGDWDLVILGYQPWFLHPSQPTTAFLQSEDAKKLLAGKPVITVIGCRNMWLHAEECVKEDLLKIGANLVGNIVLVDTNPNLVSTLTVIRWAFKGIKERTRFLPVAGVQDKDVQDAARFGPIILKHLKDKDWSSLQTALLDADALTLNTGLVLLEQRGMKNFRKWAKYIAAKGGPGDPARAGRVTQFQRLLIVAIFILSPISSLAAGIQRRLKDKKLREAVKYHKQLKYEPGML